MLTLRSLGGANLPWLVGGVFVACALLFHAFGPICGWYDFRYSLIVVTMELNQRAGWAGLLLLVGGVLLLEPAGLRAQWSLKLNPWRLGRDSLVSGLFCVAYGAEWGVPSLWWNALSMYLLVLGVVWWVGPWRALKSTVVVVLGYLLVGYAFTLLKGAVFLRGVALDPELAAWDRALFGVDVYQVMAAWVQESFLRMDLADSIYLQLFSLMLFNLLACAYLGGDTLVRRYGLALLYCYAAGVVLYLVLPAYGPFVYGASDFAHGWRNGPWRVADIQRFILANTQSAAICEGGSLAPFAYVAAMPSLHMAVPALGVAMMWGYWRALVWSLLPLSLTVFSALATGMHYGVDIIAGGLLALFSARLARR